MTGHWLITGAGGMLARDLVEELRNRGHVALELTRDQLDITDAQQVHETVSRLRPDIIVNCAGYTAVDRAEEEENLATAINGSAVESLAGAANVNDAVLTQVSTDFVFDGAKTTPYELNDATNPVSAYGRSKLIGEYAATKAEKHVIVRSSWLFGVHGPNFVEAIRNQIQKGINPLRVVDDQRGRPTYTPHLATAIIRLSLLAFEHEHIRGIFHYADEEECSWFDFAKAIVELSGASTEVVPVTSDEFQRPAKRPPYSTLSTDRYTHVTGAQPESWREGLEEYLAIRP